jgi:hypothetical protein
MSNEHTSNPQREASNKQSKADRTGVGKKQASDAQSKADHRAYPKHGL